MPQTTAHPGNVALLEADAVDSPLSDSAARHLARGLSANATEAICALAEATYNRERVEIRDIEPCAPALTSLELIGAIASLRLAGLVERNAGGMRLSATGRHIARVL